MRPALLALLATLLLLGPLGCQGNTDASSSASSTSTATIPFDNEGQLVFLQNADSLVAIDIEVADTDSARQRGMMEREGFPNPTSGMLFPFPEETQRSFWMANTPVALDLFFISADSQIVHIAKYAEPVSSDNIPSREPAQFVLETPAGFADTYGILEGARVHWRRTDARNAP